MAVLSAPAKAGDDHHIAAMIGAYDVLTSDPEPAASFGGEFRPDWRLVWEVRPMVGGFVTTDQTLYGYAGLQADINVGKAFGGTGGVLDHIFITPGAAIGAWSQGDAPKDLGHVVEFRSGVEVTYRFDNGIRMGGTLHHLSNASLGDDNPGAEIATFVFVIPTQRLGLR